ncbi:MAG TPA: Bcr/CflA family multidrug efflux MFS transporter [Pyrinomonadaceae bacterium]|jgi:DHA1 family bicyclomycin/chloramphenicol resistance-like MFS transporter
MNHSPDKANRFYLLVVILASLIAFAPLSIDMYLPAFPQIAEDFAVSHGRVELSLATFFVGLSFGQLMYGTAADRFGRKLPLYVGLTIYCLASIICAFAPNIETLIVLRFFQALGGCSGIVIARAIVRDLFEHQESARVFSLLMLVMGVAPILAPLIGGYVAIYFGWRAIFFVLAVFSAFSLLAVYAFLRETKEPNPDVQLSRTFSTYWNIFKDKEFLGFTFAGGLAQAGMFAYITGSPFVFINLFHIPAESYGWIFGLNALGLIAFSQLNGRLLRTYNPNQLLRLSLSAITIFGLFLILGGVFQLGFWAITIPLFLYIASLGMIFPNATAGALAKQQAHAGAASALLGTLQYILAAVSSGLVSYFNNGTTLPMTALIGGCGIASFLVFITLIAERKYKIVEQES